MQDLDKPLRMVNRPLWEEMSRYTEKEVCSGHFFCRPYRLVANSPFGNVFVVAAQIFWRQTEGEKQHLQKNEQSSLPSNEGGLVLAPPAGSTGTSRLLAVVAPAAPPQGSLWTFLCFQAEEQNLRDKIEKADEMIRSLDGCIGGLEAGMWREPRDCSHAAAV